HDQRNYRLAEGRAAEKRSAQGRSAKKRSVEQWIAENRQRVIRESDPLTGERTIQYGWTENTNPAEGV
ncbi:MAG: hypothetical protein WA399_02470, partial [Acidobacteriaceae bacterium]